MAKCHNLIGAIAALATSIASFTANAQQLPRYDVRAACERWSTSHNADVIKMCVNHENLGYNVLQMDWGRASKETKTACISRITSDVLPYQTLMMCIEGNAP